MSPSVDGDFDYVTRTSRNNGVESVTNSVNGVTVNESNSFSLGLMQMTAFYRPRPWYAGQFVRKILPRKKDLTERQMLYFLTLLEKLRPHLLSVLVRDVDKEFNGSLIEVPTRNGDIDFPYMEQYVQELEADRIEELEADRIEELEAYLKVSGLHEYRLTSEEEKMLSDYREFLSLDFDFGSSYYSRGKRYSVSETGIFNITPTKKKINANSVSFDGSHPYVARSESRNGIRGNINYDTNYLNPAKTISFGQDTATLYYQPNDYFTGDKIQILSLNSTYGKISENVGLYLISSAKKAFANYKWGQQSFAVDSISELKMSLPINDNGILDRDKMDTMITAIKKLVIKDVVDWADKKIAATKQVTNTES